MRGKREFGKVRSGALFAEVRKDKLGNVIKESGAMEFLGKEKPRKANAPDDGSPAEEVYDETEEFLKYDEINFSVVEDLLNAFEATSGTGAVTSRNISEKSRISGAPAPKGKEYDENYDDDFDKDEDYGLPTNTGVSATGGTSNRVVIPVDSEMVTAPAVRKDKDAKDGGDEIRLPDPLEIVKKAEIKKASAKMQKPDSRFDSSTSERMGIVPTEVTKGAPWEFARNKEVSDREAAIKRREAAKKSKPTGYTSRATVAKARTAINKDNLSQNFFR